MKLIIEKRATCEFDAAIGWFEKQRRGLGLEFAADARAAFIAIAADPQRWPIVLGTKRQAPCGKWPYSVIYRVNRNAVRILSVFHHKRDLQEWMDRT